MTSLPLHPALVHIPLGLAFVIPVLAAGFGWAIWTGRLRLRAWLVVVALQAVLLGGGLLAISTGQREEERVEKVVPETALSRHESAAEQFVWLTGLTLVPAGLVFLLRRRAATGMLTAASVAGTLLVAGAAIRVGHAGGELVYVHNAGAAYSSPARASSQAAKQAAPDVNKVRSDDDDR